MSEALEKARAALDAAKEFAPEVNRDAPKKEKDLMYLDLLSVASAQANIAQAEALEGLLAELRTMRRQQYPQVLPSGAYT